MPKRRHLPSASRRPSGARRSRPMRSRSTAPKSRARCARQMPARFCSPESPIRRGPRWSPTVCCGPSFSPAGAFARWRAASPATIQCPITTARSGRMTTRSSRLGFARYGFKRAARDAVHRPVPRGHLYGVSAAAGTVLRIPAPRGPWPHALSGRLLAAGLGQRYAVRLAASLAWPAIRSVRATKSASAIRGCRHFLMK